MGFSKKHQVDGDSIEGKKWVISGIALKPLTNNNNKRKGEEFDEGTNSGSTTPTTKESRVPEKFDCPPPPPRKRRPASSSCHRKGDVEYFNSPELDLFFEQFANSERRKYVS
ncbi:cyclin-dependent protein kinase inhibitor SMR8-like [Bidens hawaiensis]|uniref:cyclin-dependent protein kinase inhibitor SMR8-like n=1 Tax=Bidens hawaiensis TaxID=980011 RepID=UPI00404A8B07